MMNNNEEAKQALKNDFNDGIITIDEYTARLVGLMVSEVLLILFHYSKILIKGIIL